MQECMLSISDRYSLTQTHALTGAHLHSTQTRTQKIHTVEVKARERKKKLGEVWKFDETNEKRNNAKKRGKNRTQKHH